MFQQVKYFTFKKNAENDILILIWQPQLPTWKGVSNIELLPFTHSPFLKSLSSNMNNNLWNRKI